MPKAVQNSPPGHQTVHALLGFAHSLQSRLPSVQPDASLVAEVEQQTKLAANVTQRQQVKRLFGKELSTTGRNLWNTCVRLPPPKADTSSVETLRLRTRHFAFSLMHLAKWPGAASSETSFDDVALLLTMLFKICRLCMHANGLDVAVDAITKAAHCVALLPDMKARLTPEQLEECRGLEVQNLCLRTALAWKEDRLEVAEAMYAKTELLRDGLAPEAAERLAEVLYEMGRGLAEKTQHGLAARWLGRTLDVLGKQDVEMMSRDALNLKDAAYQTMVTSLLETGVEADRATAAAMVQQMAEEMGEKPIVLALRLEIFDKAADGQFDGKAYADAILGLDRLISCTETNAGLVQQHILSLHQRNPIMGCKTMDQWLLKQAQAGRLEGVEAGVRERINMATQQKGVTQTIFDLMKLLDGLLELRTPPLDGMIAFNAQAVIWKKIEGIVASTENALAVAEGWCQVACHPLLENGGQVNQAKLRRYFPQSNDSVLAKNPRKLLGCALEYKDIEMARTVLQDMPEDMQNEPLTRYLVFQLALLLPDRELALESLEHIVSGPQDSDLLYACVVHAQAHADKVLVCHTMLALIENLDAAAKPCTPALLRCALRLLGQQLKDQEDEETKQIVEKICAVCDKVLQKMQGAPLDEAGTLLYSIRELDYFSKTSLNLVIKHRETLDLGHVVRISHFCLRVNQHYPPNLSDAQAGDARLRSMWCHFMAACAMGALARCDKETRSQTYMQLTEHVFAYGEMMQRADSFEDVLQKDLRGKLAHLLLFDLEAAVHLHQDDRLKDIIDMAVRCKDAGVLKGMADCLLRGELRPEYLYPAMKAILNGLWEVNGFELSAMAKFARCLFQALLPVDTGMCEELLGTVIEMAREPTDVEVSFPREEVEWLVVRAWNQACDFRAGGRAADFERWAAVAATLARYVPDEGRILAQVEAAVERTRKDGCSVLEGAMMTEGDGQ